MEQVQVKGTVNSNKAPWETYSATFEDKSITPQLQAEIDAYSQKRHTKSSSQNEEELCRQKEFSEGVAKQYQWVHPSEYADAGARIGRIMHSSEFILKLRNECNIKCWYRTHPQAGKVTLVIKKLWLEPEVGCWVQLGYMPELSIMNFDEHGVPMAEKYRGWRTCILQLILKDVLTEQIANKVFGPPKATEAYDRYNSILKSYRQGEGRV